MSDTALVAVSTLLRWRAFREALAERDRIAVAAELHEAGARRDEAQSVAAGVARHREALLSAPNVDLGLLQRVAACETRALDDVRDRLDALAACEQRHDDARAAHLRARADVRVAETRHARLSAEAADLEEKRMFDRMASLVAAGGGVQADD